MLSPFLPWIAVIHARGAFFCLAVHRLRDKKNVPGYPAWDADILSTQYHSNWPTVHFACTCYTLLIDNGFGSRQRLLSRSGFQAALESPFSKPCRALFERRWTMYRIKARKPRKSHLHYIIAIILQWVAHMKISSRLLFHIFILIKMLCQQYRII